MNNFYKKGISVIEILVVLAVIVFFISIVLFEFSKSREQQVLKNALVDSLSSINKARTQTLSSLNSSVYGIHFESDKVIIFKGIVFDNNDSSNEIINIISPANISNVTLGGVSGATGEMYFNRLYGAPSKTGTITISTNSFSKTLTISATGSVSSN
jgi:type II secretory pathway pseudopilin PulG